MGHCLLEVIDYHLRNTFIKVHILLGARYSSNVEHFDGAGDYNSDMRTSVAC